MKFLTRLLVILVTLLLTHPCQANFFNKKPGTKVLVQFDNSFCKAIGKDPVINICLSGNSGEEEFNEHKFKAIKSKTKHLIKEYRKANQKVEVKFSEEFPCEDGPSAACQMFCDSHPSDPYCQMYYPPPPPPHPCAGGASSACLAYCGSNPGDTLCWAAYPSSCEWDDWDPYQCDPANLGTYCDNYPSDTEHCP